MEMLLKILLEMISCQTNLWNAIFESCGWIFKALFWFGGGFNSDSKEIRKIDETIEKAGETKIGQKIKKVDQGLGKACYYLDRTFWDILLTLLTGGLWIFWIIIRHFINKNKKRA